MNASGIVAALAVCAAFAGCAPSAQQDSGPVAPLQETVSLKAGNGAAIVSYNVENLFDVEDDPAIHDEDFLPQGKLRWTADRYRHKLDQLAKAITWAGSGPPVLLGLAEVENEGVLRDLVRTAPLSKAGYAIVHFDSPDERGIDVALLVRRDFAQVLKEEPLQVNLGHDRTRDVLYAELQLADGGKLHMLMNHWPSRGGGVEMSAPKRMAAAKVVRRKVDGILQQDPGAKVLIMGDFNDHPRDASIQAGLKAACGLDEKADLFDLMCMGQQPNSGSYQYDGKWDYLDQMIVSRALLNGNGVTVRSAKAFHDDRLLFRHPKYGPSPNKTYSGGHYKGGFSDHLPVVAFFEFR